MEAKVEHIAKLSRLAISEEELKTFGPQLSNILEYVEQLSKLDIEEVEPTSHVLNLVNVWREDSPVPSLPVDEAMSNAPDRSDKFYRVPKIIE